MSRPSTVILLVVAALLAALPAATAGVHAYNSTSTVSIPAGSSVVGCESTNECFIPASVTIVAGGTVTWSNDDTAAHTVTSTDNSPMAFDSSLFLAGTTFEVTFSDPGEYPYWCVVHPWRTGVVGVIDPAPPPAPGNGPALVNGAANITGMLPDGTPVELMATWFERQRVMKFDIVFVDSENVNYDIAAVQGGKTVLRDIHSHEYTGMGFHRTDPLDHNPDEFPLYVTVTGDYKLNTPNFFGYLKNDEN